MTPLVSTGVLLNRTSGDRDATQLRETPETQDHSWMQAPLKVVERRDCEVAP